MWVLKLLALALAGAMEILWNDRKWRRWNSGETSKVVEELETEEKKSQGEEETSGVFQAPCDMGGPDSDLLGYRLVCTPYLL